MDEIAGLFADEWRVSDKGTAQKFIRKAIARSGQYKPSIKDACTTINIDWDEFNSIFCKGICKFTFVEVSKKMMQQGSASAKKHKED